MEKRLNLLLGNENLEKVKKLNILVFGVGGVGGFVVESLTRSFINSITIVDFDTIDISNINRQIIATTSSIGLNKVDVLEKRIKDINPSIEVFKYKELVTNENIDMFFNREYDFVVDCIDDVKAKLSIIEKCQKSNIKIITSTGTGNKLYPDKLKITTLDKTSYDPLSKILRTSLKKMHLSTKVVCVSSIEEPKKNDTNIIGSCAFVPSVAGLLITSYIINSTISQK